MTCGGGGAPKPLRDQSTTLLWANLPQMSSAPGAIGGAAGLDQSDAGVTGGGGVMSHAEAGAAAAGAFHSPGVGLGVAAGGVQACDIGPPPAISGRLFPYSPTISNCNSCRKAT